MAMMGRLGVARFCVVVLLFVVLWGIGGGGSVQGQALSGAWTIRAYEGVEDTLQRWYSISALNFADTSVGFAYWRYNNRDSLRGSGWRRTTDGGITWHLFSVAGLDAFVGRFALRGAYGINVVPSSLNGVMRPYLTRDSGHTWTLPPLPTVPVVEIVADELRPTELEGVQNMALLHEVAGQRNQKRLLVTTDGGSSWQRLDSTLFVGLPDSLRARYSVLDLHWLRDTVLTLMTGVMDTTLNFGDNLEIWEVGIGGAVLRRTSLPTDLGQLQHDPGKSFTRSIRFSDSAWIFLYRYFNNPRLSLTDDAGRTWKSVEQVHFQPYGAFYLAPTLLVRAGGFESNDTGHTIRPWGSPYGASGLVVLDSLHWIVSMGSIITQTNDGGHTWKMMSGYRPITEMQVAEGVLLLTSPWHRILRSRDRGETYEDVTDRLPPYVTKFTSLCARDPDRPEKMAAVAMEASYELGGRQVLLRSDDAGTSWDIVRDLTSLGRGTVTNLQFVRRTDVPGSVVGWLTSDSGMSITTDGGTTWEHRTHRRGAITMFDERFGWTAVDTLVFRTTDGTVTWDTSYRLPFFYRNLQGFKAFDSLRAVALVPSVMIPPYWKSARTTNGGRTWDTLKLSIDFLYTRGQYIWINSNSLYLTDSGKMWLSRDGAMSFAAETPDTSGWQRGTLDRRTIYFFGKGAVGRWDITDTSLSDVPTQLLPLVASKQLQIETLSGGFIAHLAPNNEEYRLELYDIAGHLVQRRDLRRGETDIRVDDLVAGWYSLRLVSQSNAVVDGSVVVTQ